MASFIPHASTLRALCSSLRAHGALLAQMVRRDVAGRYRGSALGVLWSFVTPLLMLTIYTLVFTHIFNARAGAATTPDAHTGTFAVFLFAGLIVHMFFMECLSRAPSIVLAHGNFVKKVIFPLEILPVMILCTALFHTAMSAAVLLAGTALVTGTLHATALLLPLVWLPFLLLSLGLCFMLASLGVFLRDIGQMMGLVSMVLMFLSPIFYPVSALPEQWQRWAYLNPLTLIIEQTRTVLIDGAAPRWDLLGFYGLLGTGSVMLGFWWFQKTRKGFADVL